MVRVVMFLDCHDFSRLMDELGDTAIEFIDRMYRDCGECIVGRGGRIVKYMGDAVLAVFGEADAAAAVEAARCARRAYRDLLAARRTTVQSEMEVGLSCGAVAEGVVGHPSLRAWDVFGEAVNEAAVIGHHRGIALTDEVRRRIEAETATREIAPFHPKWRRDALRIWEVVDPD